MTTSAAVAPGHLAVGRKGRSQPFPISLHRLHRRLLEWHHRSQSRRELAQLDSRMLRDIGVGDAERLAEVRKPFWRP